MSKELTCFQAYDIRGIIGENFDRDICYQISRAFAQTLNASKVVLGRDIRDSSISFQESIVEGLVDQGVEVLDIGLCGTEEVYSAVTVFNACGGIMITASHNPKNYNGLKLVKKSSKPLDPDTELIEIKKIAESNNFIGNSKLGSVVNVNNEARSTYVKNVTKFLGQSKVKPLKIVVNFGNGCAGPTFDAILSQITEKIIDVKFEKMFHDPDGNFPNGVPNPLLEKNQFPTSEKILETEADFGVAFDGDFDRCFFFDDNGEFINGEFIVGLFAKEFLEKEPNSKIVHDPRRIWNIKDVISKNNGVSVISRTGHAYLKKEMRLSDAIYGGEISGHHYFRDFSYCDSGMIPWLLMLDILSKSPESLSSLIAERRNLFSSSEEINISVPDPKTAINKVRAVFEKESMANSNLDGISYEFNNWRFNLRQSNTEPLIRLNVESKEGFDHLNEKVVKLIKVLKR